MRLERAEYEAALAERRYQEVDPSLTVAAKRGAILAGRKGPCCGYAMANRGHG
jgi:hypothetical protein